jgi:Zn-dependent protease
MYYYTPAPYVSSKKFSARELRELALSSLVLTLAFTIAFRELRAHVAISLGHTRWALELVAEGVPPEALVFAVAFFMSGIAITTGFVSHELAHKFVAQRYGCWAEYRMFLRGLLLALLFSLFGFVFAAPGAVYILGRVNTESNGRISAAGPSTNLIVALLAFPLALTKLPWVALIATFAARINVFLAGFNLIPFPPLDGSKVFRWSVARWALLLLATVALGILVFFGPAILAKALVV